METSTELKALRYMMNNIILQLYDLRIKMEELSPTKRKYEVAEPNVGGNDVAFDLFTVPKKKYNELVEKFGYDIVNIACNRLDDYVRINEHIPYGNASNALARKFIRDVAIEKASELKQKKEAITIDKVVDKKTAELFISTIPSHLQDVNEDVIKLKEEYEL